MFKLILLLLYTCSIIQLCRSSLFPSRPNSYYKYEPTWKSIDSRPLPTWFDDDKLGIFSHWGVYSVPAFGSEWFWWYWKGEKRPEFDEFVAKHYPNGTTYGDFAKEFTAEDLNPDNFADVIKASGARYFVLTSKHHEGFTMWPSKTSWNWNAVDIGPHQDLISPIAKSIRAKGIKFGLYFSLFDWFHPLYLSDKATNGTRSDYVEQVSYPQLLEIVNQYKPYVIWSDGDWEQSDKYWKSKEFLAWLYNDSPIKDFVAVNDRWGSGMAGKHGGFMTYSDHYDPGHLVERKWENCLTLDRYSWGYRRDLKAGDVRTVKELIEQLVRTISCNGNLLLNIGPDSKGRIMPIFEERLRGLGDFVNTNSEAIFGTKPWIYQNDSDTTWYTSKLRNQKRMGSERVYNPQSMKNTIIYAFVTRIPTNGTIWMPSVRITDKTRVVLLGTQYSIPYQKTSSTLRLNLDQVPWQHFPSKDVLVFKIEYAASDDSNPMLKHSHHHHHHYSNRMKNEELEM